MVGHLVLVQGIVVRVHVGQPNLCFLQAKRSTQKSSNSLRGCFRILEKTQEDEFWLTIS